MLIVVIYIIPEGRAAGFFQFLNLHHYMGITETGNMYLRMQGIRQYVVQFCEREIAQHL